MKSEKSLRRILFFGILVMIALLSARFNVRMDMTKSKSYSLSNYTKSILTDLKDPTRVTWYRSNALTHISPEIRHIEDILEEYRISSAGNFTYRIINTDDLKEGLKPDALGILPRQIETGTKEYNTVRTIYTGLVIESAASTKVIPFLAQSRLLEYELSRSLIDLEEQNRAPAVAKGVQVIFGSERNIDYYQYVVPWLTYAGFTVHTQSYPLQPLDPLKPLIVIGSSRLDQDGVKAIDAFLSQGGAAVFFVSGTDIATTTNWSANPKQHDSLIEYLSLRGITIENKLVIDQDCFHMTLPSLDNSKYETINYPFWVTVETDGQKKNVLLSGIGNLQFYWPSSILLSAETSQKMQAFAFSSHRSKALGEPFDTNPFDKQIDTLTDGDSNRSILAVSGTLNARIVVVADEHFSSAMNDYTGTETNLDFLVNCTEWLMGKDTLLQLKRPFAPMKDASKIAETVSYRNTRITCLFIIPIILVLLLVWCVALRSKQQ